MHVNVFDFSKLLAQSSERYLEFVRVSAFSVGIDVLDGGATDLQKPHSEDEVYYVANGRAKMMINSDGDTTPSTSAPAQSSSSRPGSIIPSMTSPSGSSFWCSSAQPRVRQVVLHRNDGSLDVWGLRLACFGRPRVA